MDHSEKPSFISLSFCIPWILYPLYPYGLSVSNRFLFRILDRALVVLFTVWTVCLVESLLDSQYIRRNTNPSD